MQQKLQMNKKQATTRTFEAAFNFRRQKDFSSLYEFKESIQNILLNYPEMLAYVIYDYIAMQVNIKEEVLVEDGVNHIGCVCEVCNPKNLNAMSDAKD